MYTTTEVPPMTEVPLVGNDIKQDQVNNTECSKWVPDDLTSICE